MRLGKWVLGVAAVALLFGGTAMAQIDANRICLHNGSEFYVNGPFYGYPNHGAGKYFPSFAHNPAQPYGAIPIYPWKIAGWAWGGMQANNFGIVWYWETLLQSMTDNPRASTMSFDYPVLFCTGVVPHTGFPMPIYGGTIPSGVPIVGGNQIVFPSSAGGFNAYLNVFAVGAASWVIPSTQPFYGWLFGFSFPCVSAITLPSSDSIWECTFNNKGPNDQYTLLSGDEVDCLGGSGNKGRNYSLISDADNGYLWAWLNACDGIAQEWQMCIFVCDTVTIPVNVPGDPDVPNPFAPYGFDVGSTTLTPYLSSNCVSLGFMTEDYDGSPGQKIILAAFAFTPGPVVYGKKQYRLGCMGFDILTGVFLNISQLFAHTVAFPYPACMFGQTTGGHSLAFPFPADPALMCAEIKYCSYDTGPGQAPSASYMVTYF